MLRCSETIKARRRYICPSIYLRAWTRKEGEKAGTKEKDTPTRYGPGHGRVVLQQRKRVHIDLYIDTHEPEYNICARISTLGLTWGDSGIRGVGVSTPPFGTNSFVPERFPHVQIKFNHLIWTWGNRPGTNEFVARDRVESSQSKTPETPTQSEHTQTHTYPAKGWHNVYVYIFCIYICR